MSAARSTGSIYTQPLSLIRCANFIYPPYHLNPRLFLRALPHLPPFFFSLFPKTRFKRLNKIKYGKTAENRIFLQTIDFKIRYVSFRLKNKNVDSVVSKHFDLLRLDKRIYYFKYRFKYYCILHNSSFTYKKSYKIFNVNFIVEKFPRISGCNYRGRRL